MSQQPMLFYSTRCTHSQSILRTLDAMQKTSLVKLVSIDGVQRAQLPPFLKSVPTLYLPDTKDTLVGQAIYSYIAKPVAARQERPAGSGGVASQGPPGSAPGGGEPGAWGFSSGGITESFSSWDRPDQFTQQDQLQYSFLSGSAPSGGPGGNNLPQNIQQRGGESAGSDDLKKRLEQMQAQRDKEFTPVMRQ